MEEKIGEWIKQEERPNGYVRYYRPGMPKGAKHLQIAKYRDADDMDKSLNTHYEWHGKWYVNTWNPEKTKLFNSKKEAIAWAKKYMRSGK